ncbi:hypothetical protein Hanom_Chr07g00597521 [Helianthus anomalus]
MIIVRFWRVVGRGRFGRSKSRVSHIIDLVYCYLTGLLPHLLHHASRVASSAIRGIRFISIVLYGGSRVPSIAASPSGLRRRTTSKTVHCCTGGGRKSRLLPSRWASFHKRAHCAPRGLG